MKIPAIRRILKEDLSQSGETLPAWLDSLLDPLNTFIDLVAVAIRGKLTLQDNFAGKALTVTLTHNTPLAVSTAPLRTRVTGVIPLAFGTQTLSGYKWQIKDNGDLELTVQYLAGSGSADCTFYLLTG